MKKLLRSMQLVAGALTALALVTPALAQGQSAVLTGRVVSEQGQPLSGASVLVPELNISVTTNPAGAYTIIVPAARVRGQSVVVRARAIGYQPIANPITLNAGSQTVDFNLKQDLTQLAAVVVTGVTAATQQVKLPFTVAHLDSAQMPVTGSNPISQIQGKIPGAQIVAASGRPGTAPSIVLRGPVSLDATGRSEEPLYLLDGVPLQGSLPDISPSDIENIEVVKGAAAAALYGARAGAGVINITTKSGKTGPEGVKIGARTEIGASDLERAFPLSKATDLVLDPTGKQFCATVVVGGSNCGRYIDWDQEVQRINNDGLDYSLPPQQFLGDLGFASAPTYEQMTGTFDVTPWPVLRDPVRQLITSAPYANSSVDVRAKVNNTGVYASIANLSQQGAVQYMGGFLRNSARVNMDQRFGDRVSANLNSYYSQTIDHPDNGAFFSITRAPWMADLQARDALGRIVVNHNPLSNSSQNYNPLYDAQYIHQTDRGTRFVGGASLHYTPLDWLNLDGNFGYDRSTNEYLYLRDKGWRTTSPNATSSSGYIGNGNSDNEQYTTGLSAAASKTLGDLISTFTTRYTYGDQSLRGQDLSGTHLVEQGLETALAATQDYTISSSVQQIRDMGFFFGADFDFKDRYVLSGLLRRDGSSLFGAGNRWATFGRVAGAWIVSREPWWPAANAISLFKLRASQGTTGQRPRFDAQYETFTIGAGGTLSPDQLGNKFLRPEVNKETELGTNIELFGKFGLDLTHSKAVIDHQILPVTASSASGFSSVWLNAGELTNRTWEATLTLPIVTRGALSWTSRVIYDKTTSKITRLDVPDFTGTVFEGGNPFSVFKFRTGETVGTLYGRDFVKNCSQLPTGYSSQCSMNSSDVSAAFRPNDQGYIVWVGAGNQTTEGITKNLWRAQLPIGSSSCGVGCSGPWGNRTNWGMPITLRDSLGNKMNVAVGNALPKYHWGLSQTIDWKRINLYGLLDAARGQKIWNVQYAWSLGDLTSGAVDQTSVSVQNAKPVGYYWRQGPSKSPTDGSTAGVGGFYDVLGPNTYNTEDASYVKLREVSANFRVGSIFGNGDWKVGFVGRNLKTWTKFRGFDPEAGDTGGPFNSAALTGITSYSYPKLRTYTFQLSTSF
ncbi:MAG TPA: SusC/RagA family TonB-linked outer membrane protein [Gemmatimonadaceae bacterium]